jgi:hypothetical protein
MSNLIMILELQNSSFGPLAGAQRRKESDSSGKSKVFCSFNTITEFFLVNFSWTLPRSEVKKGSPKGSRTKILPDAAYIRVEISRCL